MDILSECQFICKDKILGNGSRISISPVVQGLEQESLPVLFEIIQVFYPDYSPLLMCFIIYGIDPIPGTNYLLVAEYLPVPYEL